MGHKELQLFFFFFFYRDSAQPPHRELNIAAACLAATLDF
jgi:hypothetical protein